MVGGKVIGIARGQDSTLVHVQDTTYVNDRCSVRCIERRKSDNAPVTIEVGDSIWWQCGCVYWTPAANVGATCDHREHYDCRRRCGVNYDIALPKVGYSH